MRAWLIALLALTALPAGAQSTAPRPYNNVRTFLNTLSINTGDN